MDEEIKEVEKVEEKPLSKREQKKLAKQEKKELKKKQREEERAFELAHPLRKRKRTAWMLELIGLGFAAVPAVLILGLSIVALFAAVWGILVFIVLIMGFIFFGLGYLIYAQSTEHPSTNGYFHIGTSIFDWIANLFNFLNKIQGWFFASFAGISLILEIIGFVLLMTSLNACSKRHKKSYIVLMCLIMTLSIGLLTYGLIKMF
jgi:cation transport ATPase